MTYLEAYNQDEAVRWRNALNKLFLRERIIAKKEQVAWSKSELYAHPLKLIKGKRKVEDY